MYIKGADLRRMRLSAHLTTGKMAGIAGVKTRKTYENWEANVGSPNINQFISLCRGCGTSPSRFVREALKRKDIRTPLEANAIANRKSKI